MSEELRGYTRPQGPRIIKKHKESDFTNPFSSWSKITTFFGSISVIPAWQLINESYSQDIQLALAACSFIGVRYWLKYCGMDPKKADRSWIHFWFWVDKKLGKHSFNRLTTGASWWERLIGRKMSIAYPVVRILPGGIVQFDDNQFAVYADLKGKKKSDEERKLHRMYMKGVMDGMRDNQMIKFVSTSKKNPRKAVINYLTKLAEKKGTKERAKHLNALIQKVIKDKREAKVQRVYVMIGLGEHESVESAIHAKKSMTNGVMSNLKRAKLEPKIITNKRQIEKLLRESTSETAVF